MQPFFTRNDGDPLHAYAVSEPTGTTEGCSPRPGFSGCGQHKALGKGDLGVGARHFQGSDRQRMPAPLRGAPPLEGLRGNASPLRAPPLTDVAQ